MEIGSKIKKSRIDAKLTQEQAAEALGISRQAVYNTAHCLTVKIMLVCELLFAVFLPQYGVNALRVFVKRNFLGVGKSYTIKGKQAEKKAENALCGRLKCVLVTGSIKPLPTSEKRLRQG